MAPPGGNGDCTMKVGDLVKTTRVSVCYPAGSLGLVTRVFAFRIARMVEYPACEVFMFSKQRIKRSIQRDLEVLEATIS